MLGVTTENWLGMMHKGSRLPVVKIEMWIEQMLSYSLVISSVFSE